MEEVVFVHGYKAELANSSYWSQEHDEWSQPGRNCSIVGGGAYTKEQLPLGHCECRVQNLIFQEKLKFQILCSICVFLILALNVVRISFRPYTKSLQPPHQTSFPSVVQNLKEDQQFKNLTVNCPFNYAQLSFTLGLITRHSGESRAAEQLQLLLYPDNKAQCRNVLSFSDNKNN